MINRDFSRSAGSYINRNKIVLILITLIIIAGCIMAGVFGFNASSDMKGYNTFDINIGMEYKESKLDDYNLDIKSTLSEYKASLQTVQVCGEGDQLCLTVKYIGKINDQAKFNQDLAEGLQLSSAIITEHSQVSASVTAKDYIYTIACALIIVTLVALFTNFRYNLACAVTSIISSIVGSALLLSLTAIFRLSIDTSFFAINILSIVLILAECLMMFDSLEKARTQLDDKNNRNAQLSNALKSNSFRKQFTSCAIFALGLLLVILAPTPIKRIGLVILFTTVVVLFVSAYVIPFIWCLTINKVNYKIRVRKVENKVAQTNTSVESELEEEYTENQVIEVKEDSEDSITSNDDNITIE